VDELADGDQLELRGPIGGYFTWDVDMAGPLLLVGGGSGICPLMSMIRHRAARGSRVPTRLLYSSRSLEDVIYKVELDALAGPTASRPSALDQPEDSHGRYAATIGRQRGSGRVVRDFRL